MPIRRNKRINTVKVVPVIDVLGGVVVHAIRGKRSKYQPLKSVLCPSTNPFEVAKAFKKLGFSEIYLADLDGILARHPNFSVLKQIAETTGLSLMVDAGIKEVEEAKKLLNNHVSKVIIGTETMPKMNFVKEAVDTLGKEQIIVSLDLKGEKVLGKLGLGQSGNPLYAFKKILETSVNQIIILDLTRVGSGEGVNMPLLQKMMKNRGVEIFVGGGVRGMADLKTLEKVGVSGVLIATVLHSGKITWGELKQAGFLL